MNEDFVRQALKHRLHKQAEREHKWWQDFPNYSDIALLSAYLKDKGQQFELLDFNNAYWWCSPALTEFGHRIVRLGINGFLKRLFAELDADTGFSSAGIRFIITSAFRSTEKQAELLKENYRATDPSCSTHCKGVAVDINIGSCYVLKGNKVQGTWKRRYKKFYDPSLIIKLSRMAEKMDAINVIPEFNVLNYGTLQPACLHLCPHPKLLGV